jgi:hypothetical protein
VPEPDEPRDGEPPPRWMKLIEPFRSEAAAFRMLLAVAVICGVIAIVVLAARALF